MSVMKDAIAIVRSFSRLHNEFCMFSLSPDHSGISNIFQASLDHKRGVRCILDMALIGLSIHLRWNMVQAPGRKCCTAECITSLDTAHALTGCLFKDSLIPQGCPNSLYE